MRAVSPSPDTRPGGQGQQAPNAAVLDGVLELVTFCNPETGYTIARIAPDRGTGRGPVSAGTELVTAVGPLLGAQVGESLRPRGPVVLAPEVRPAVRGLVVCDRAVRDRAGHEPARLIEVAGLGPKRCARITAAWAGQRAIKEVMIFLQGVGVSTSLAVKIYKKYGDESVETVKREPCKLASDIWGIGFKTADTIAASVGIAKDSPERIKAGLADTLSETADDGHCYLPEETLVAEGVKILGVPADKVAAQVPDLGAEELAVRGKVPGGQGDGDEVTEAVYLPPFYHSERSLAATLKRLLASGEDRLPAFQAVDWTRAFAWLKTRTGPTSPPGRPTR